MQQPPRLNFPDGLVLAIETSNPSSWSPGCPVLPGVAATRIVNGTPGPVHREPCDPRTRDDTLLVALDRATRAVGCVPGELVAMVVSVGPGGFTALRIACAVAKMLSLATGARVFAVPSARVVLAGTPKIFGPVAVALASKGNDAWITCYSDSNNTTTIIEPQLMNAHDLGELRQYGIHSLVADAFLPPEMRTLADQIGLVVVPPVFDPAACLTCAGDSDEVAPENLAPIYARPPEAVRKWREMRGGT